MKPSLKWLFENRRTIAQARADIARQADAAAAIRRRIEAARDN